MDFESPSRNKSHRRHGLSSTYSLVPSFPYSPSPSLSSSSSSSSFASSSSNFSPTFLSRTTSPPRVRMCGHSVNSSQSIRFSIDNRPTSPGRSISVAGVPVGRRHEVRVAPPTGKKTCMCSPTNHPGSFRCSLHKNLGHGQVQSQGQFSSSRSLNFRRSAMTNSLVRIGGVEGDLVKRALAALIRPSSHQMRRRFDFKPRPSRLSVMCRAAD
ncbi:hypothetical protein MLD38_005314 [Melastoma candidum]|uniref:Uncharacterized protein n=1 Tax=Melastoma candidum TaxID=119954 RepID=A0ACB9SBR0_9MYRT|nr:hypothetical protein MLD38_040897 [Melastoma candidum]KAI4294834.1 hypothetical protein MLD38_040847 [Melastoma candidum]KAI4387486.1 hypothetical protein MLD38_005314 [Melastoma candidum]